MEIKNLIYIENTLKIHSTININLKIISCNNYCKDNQEKNANGTIKFVLLKHDQYRDKMIT